MRLLALTLSTMLVATQALAGTLSPLATFGGGDGWRAPNEILPGDTAGSNNGTNYNYLSTGSLERSFSYNPTTNNLVLVSRSTAGNGIRILNGGSGVDVGALNQGVGVISGGTFTTNGVDVGSDGAIYVGNLSVGAAAAFKIYRWQDESAASPTVAYNAVTGVDRVGDSFAAFGSGAGTVIAAAGSSTTTRSNFVAFKTLDGLAYTSTAYNSVPGTLTTSNDYRLGLTFVDADTLIGNQGTNGRVTDFAATATVTATIPLAVAQRPLDYAVIGSTPFLAVIDSNSSQVQVYNIANPAAPKLVASANNTSGTLTANGNATGSVAFGNVTASGATLYAMSSNQGIQAFELSGVPEPGSAMLAAFGLACASGLFGRRRS